MTVERLSTTSAIFPPRPLTALALAISAPIPTDARNRTPDRSTTTAFFGPEANSSSCGAMAFAPVAARLPEIGIQRRSGPTSSYWIVDMVNSSSPDKERRMPWASPFVQGPVKRPPPGESNL